MTKKPVRGVGNWPALQALGFRDNGRMRHRQSGDVCLLGVCANDGFWVLNLAESTKRHCTTSQLAKEYTPIQEEQIA